MYTTINKSTDHFNTVLYTGNGTDNRAVTGVGFQPDWLWIKNRSNSFSHALFDVIRGSSKMLATSSQDAEQTNAGSGGLTSFDADGFTTDAGSGGNPYRNTNENGDNYVSWNWKAGGSASSNSDGSINSNVSANTTAGFSIVSYTGTGSNATVGHGLGVAPNFIIFKNRDETQNWINGNDLLTSWEYILYLNLTNAQTSSSNKFNSTAPTSSVFSVGTGTATNGSSDNMIAYCFAEKKGYSKFGSYKGNGNADGTFVYTGFKPAFIMLKCISTSGQNWVIVDNKRDGFNADNNRLYADSASAESTTDVVDLLSNGFKNRFTGSTSNGSQTYVFMAFAEAPLVGTNNIPATAK